MKLIIECDDKEFTTDKATILEYELQAVCNKYKLKVKRIDLRK